MNAKWLDKHVHFCAHVFSRYNYNFHKLFETYYEHLKDKMNVG